MSSIGRRGCVTSLLVCLAASDLGAQSTSRFAASVLSGWSAALGMAGGWEEGLQFVNGVPAQATSGAINGSVAKLWQTRRDRIEASVGGALTKYPSNPVLDRLTYDINTGILHTFSRGTSAQIGLGASSMILNQALTAAGTGAPLLQLVRADTKSASTAFRARFGRRFGAEVSANGQDIKTSTVGIFGGQFATVAATFTGQLSRETLVSVAASNQYTRIDTSEINLPRASAAVRYRSRSGLVLGASAGTVFLPSTSVQLPLTSRISAAGNVVIPVGSAQLSAEVHRDVNQAFGFASGLLRSKSVAGGASKRFTRSLSVDGSYSVTWQEIVGSTALPTQIDAVSLGSNYGLGRGAAFSFAAFARRFSDGALQFVSRGVTTGLTYNWSQQRRSQPARP